MSRRSRAAWLVALLGVFLVPLLPADTGGGGEGDGVDVLPAWLVRWAEDNGHDLEEILAYLGGEDGYSGLTINVRGEGIDVDITLGPSAPTGEGGELAGVLVTGTIDGNAINESGWAVPTGDGRLAICNPDLEPGGFRMCNDWEDGWRWCYHGYWRIDPAEFGDGNPFDDVCGGVDSYNGGMPGNPVGRRVTTQ
jgi:hypothetical protein